MVLKSRNVKPETSIQFFTLFTFMQFPKEKDQCYLDLKSSKKIKILNSSSAYDCTFIGLFKKEILKLYNMFFGTGPTKIIISHRFVCVFPLFVDPVLICLFTLYLLDVISYLSHLTYLSFFLFTVIRRYSDRRNLFEYHSENKVAAISKLECLKIRLRLHVFLLKYRVNKHSDMASGVNIVIDLQYYLARKE